MIEPMLIVANHIDRDSGLFDCPNHADVRKSTHAAAAKAKPIAPPPARAPVAHVAAHLIRTW
jgi:hypothetical protein